MKKGGRLVEVTWMDSASNHGWFGKSDLKDVSLMEIKTVGYLVRRTSRDVALAQAYSESGRWSEIWVIPSKSVKSVRRAKT